MADEAEIDPKGLIRDSYAIDGISEPECRSIFLDWAISVPTGTEARGLITRLLEIHGQPDHPMTRVLQEGLGTAPKAGRRGGRAARRSDKAD